MINVSWQLLFFLILVMATSTCTNTRVLPIEVEPVLLTPCEAVDNISRYDGEIVRITGTLQGFHEMGMVSDDCKDAAHMVDVSIDREDMDFLLKDRKFRTVGLIIGYAVIEGKLVKDGGYTLDYEHGREVLEPGGSPIFRRTNILEDVKIIEFQQTLDQ